MVDGAYTRWWMVYGIWYDIIRYPFFSFDGEISCSHSRLIDILRWVENEVDVHSFI